MLYVILCYCIFNLIRYFTSDEVMAENWLQEVSIHLTRFDKDCNKESARTEDSTVGNNTGEDSDKPKEFSIRLTRVDQAWRPSPSVEKKYAGVSKFFEHYYFSLLRNTCVKIS